MNEVERGRTNSRYLFISAAGVKGLPDTTPFLARLPSRIIRARLGKTYLDTDAEAAPSPQVPLSGYSCDPRV